MKKTPELSPSATVLDLSNTRLDAAAIRVLAAALATLTQLQSLDLGNTHLDADAIQALVPALAKLTQLQSLNLNWNRLEAGGIQALIPALAQLPQLQSLNLAKNNFDAGGIQALVPALATLTQLKTLRLCGNYFMAAGIEALAPALAHLTQLQFLDLRCVGLNAAGIQALVPALATLTQVQTLDLYGNNLGTAAMQALVPALAYLPQLQSLYLSANDLEAAAIQALAPALVHLTQLKFLDLSQNRLDAAAIRALAPALATLAQLQSLDLSNNRLDAAAIQALVPALAKLPQLQFLDLRGNRLEAADIQALAPALAALTQLKALHLTRSVLDVNSKQLINNILTRNHNIQLITKKIQSHIDQLTHQIQDQTTLNKPDTIDEDLDALFSFAEEIKTQYNVEPRAVYDTYYQLNCALALARGDFGAALQAAQSMQKLPLKLFLPFLLEQHPIIVATVLREFALRSDNESDMLELLPHLIALKPTQSFLSKDEHYRLILSVAQLADPSGTNTYVKNLLQVVDRLPDRLKTRVRGDQAINYQQLLIESYGDTIQPGAESKKNLQSVVVSQLITVADYYEKQAITQTIRSVISPAPAEIESPHFSAAFFATRTAIDDEAKTIEKILNTLEQSEKSIRNGLQELIHWLNDTVEITPNSLEDQVTHALTLVFPIPQPTKQNASQQRDALCELLQLRYLHGSPTQQS